MQINSKDRVGFESLNSDWNFHILRFLDLKKSWRACFDISMQNDPYLAKAISSVVYLNKDEKEIFRNFDQTIPKEDIARIIVQCDHIELEYIPAEDKEKFSSFKASNLQLDFVTAEDAVEAQMAMQERARAALCLAHLAKKEGWESVSFEGTEDPLDRLALFLACEAMKLQTDETIDVKKLPKNEVIRGKTPADKDISGILYVSMSAAINVMHSRQNISFGIEPRSYERAGTGESEEDEWDLFDDGIVPEASGPEGPRPPI